MATWARGKGPALPERPDDHEPGDDDVVSSERALELARDHERPAADRFRELQDLYEEPGDEEPGDGEPGDEERGDEERGEEPDEGTLEELHAQRLQELRGDRPSIGRTLLRQGKWLVIALLAIVAVAFVAGLWFGRSDEPRAARTLLGDRVEPQPEVTAGIPGSEAPTSGVSNAEPTCGIRAEPVPAPRQVATIMAGGVVVQYRPSALDAPQVDQLRDWAKGYLSHLLVAPNAQIDAPVVATAFRHRMPLEELDIDLLSAFATGYGDAQGPIGECPITDAN